MSEKNETSSGEDNLLHFITSVLVKSDPMLVARTWLERVEDRRGLTRLVRRLMRIALGDDEKTEIVFEILSWVMKLAHQEFGDCLVDGLVHLVRKEMRKDNWYKLAEIVRLVYRMMRRKIRMADDKEMKVKNCIIELVGELVSVNQERVTIHYAFIECIS